MKNEATPPTLKALLARLEYEYDENLFSSLIPLLAGAQAHRYKIGNSTSVAVTRSTALPVIEPFSSDVAEVLRSVGLDWQKYRRQVALEETITPHKVDDVELHKNFVEALKRFSISYPDIRAATPETLMLAIIDMAVKDEAGNVRNQLSEACEDPDLFNNLLEILNRKLRPKVWILHDKDDNRLEPLFHQTDPVYGIEWRSTQIIDCIKPGDPVIYWLYIDKKAGESGSLVGTGRFVVGIGRSENIFDKKEEKEVTWYYYPTMVEDWFPDKPLDSNQLIEKTDLNLNWSLGSILEVPSEMAKKLDAYLIEHGRKGVFAKGEADEAPQIVFIGDAPKTELDFLKRGDLAFLLAARLNRIWDEINPDKEEPEKQEKGTPPQYRVGHFFDRLSGMIKFQRQRRPAFENSFVVHIDGPWGGGKTTFANYLTRILNPYRIAGKPPNWLTDLPLDDLDYWPEEFRRPWYVVSFNAWQHQHLDPPWWCFYQAVRRQCFHAVRTESFIVDSIPPTNTGHRHVKPNVTTPPMPSRPFRFRCRCIRYLTWINLWIRELGWRIFNPKVKILLSTFLMTWAVALVLHHFELFNPGKFKSALAEGLKNSTNLPAIITTGLVVFFGGATAIWSVLAALTDSLLPGTPDAAKNYSLGSGDPLERFRKHFDRTIRRIKRPILVVVDDIDRCAPKFVVELLRGIQTILKSTGVVFLILGDRDWIEHAFANIHKTMKGIDVGPEHSFGGRFVEKVIQLSLVLPDIARDDRTSYVWQLLGADTLPDDLQRRVDEVKDTAEPELQKNMAERLRETIISDETLEKPVREIILKRIGHQLSVATALFPEDVQKNLSSIISTSNQLIRDAKSESLRKTVKDNTSLAEPVQDTIIKQIDRELAFRSATDKRADQAIRHRLLPIAPALPANPRQIKRIINSIALFEGIARITHQIVPGSRQWCKLALWVVIMIEWPKTWATLSNHNPDLIERIRKLDESSTDELPDEPIIQAWAEAIRENKVVMNLLDFSSVTKPWSEVQILASDIEQFRDIMPAVGGQMLPRLETADSEGAGEEIRSPHSSPPKANP